MYRDPELLVSSGIHSSGREIVLIGIFPDSEYSFCTMRSALVEAKLISIISHWITTTFLDLLKEINGEAPNGKSTEPKSINLTIFDQENGPPRPERCTKRSSNPETDKQALERLQDQVNRLDHVSSITLVALIRICQELGKIGQVKDRSDSAIRNPRQVN
jgi:hypothetical protein